MVTCLSQGVTLDSELSWAVPMWIFLPPQEQCMKVLPWECLGSIWIEWEWMDMKQVAPVYAALTHFYRVVYFVITPCLGTHTMKAQDRARVLELWIQVARECNKLRNYSSHAIVKALKSMPIHRLQETWRAASRWVGFCLPSCTQHLSGVCHAPSLHWKWRGAQRLQRREWATWQGLSVHWGVSTECVTQHQVFLTMGHRFLPHWRYSHV
ncbi:ral guanine nucleotide dissociation stimulator-like [Nycticebus coucang]|uniref:ral guanine nucleotide dissociation stimulator-like n=1 Tax=Nycticebus coucang TaxID=9470 RepID=UPI00234E1728|nr:ral guanine nucleotide dissociation stimulator-like [Nycticebus coucang]